MLYRESQIDGRLVNLRAADGLARFVRLRSGRLPRTCVPSHCEVLRLEGPGPVPSKPTLRLIQVRTATLRPTLRLQSSIQPVQSEQVAAAVRYHAPQPSPCCSPTASTGSPARPALVVLPLLRVVRAGAAGDVPRGRSARTRSIDRAARRAGGALGCLRGDGTDRRRSPPPSAPRASPHDDCFCSAARSGAPARVHDPRGRCRSASRGRRVAAAAAGLAHAAGRSSCRRSPKRARLLLIGDRAAGRSAAQSRTASRHEPARRRGRWIDHSLLTGGGIATAACAAAAAALLLYVTVRSRPLDARPLRGHAARHRRTCGCRRRPARLLARLDRRGLARERQGNRDVFVLLVPALVTFAAAIGAVRLLLPALRGLGRVGRRGPLPLRLAAVSLSRNPGRRPSWRPSSSRVSGWRCSRSPIAATLLQGQHDEAYYAVPAPYVVDEDLSQLVPVLHGWPGGTPATQVLRLTGNVPSAASFTFLGVPEPRLSLQPSAFRSTPLRRGPSSPAGHRAWRRRCRARLLPLAARRLPGGDPRHDARSRPGRSARPHPVRRRDAQLARARSAEQRPPGGECRHRPAAHRAWPDLHLGTPTSTADRFAARSPTGSGAAGSRPRSRTGSRPTTRQSSARDSRRTDSRCRCS